MDEAFQRPKVAELQLRVYDRALHPELHDVFAVREVRRQDYRLVVRLTPAGHVLEWSRPGATLAEVLTVPVAGLPGDGKLVRSLRSSRQAKCDLAPGVHYEVCLDAEKLTPELFVHFHDELARTSKLQGLIGRAPPRHRCGLMPLGFVTLDCLPTGLAIHCFHTFPDEFTVVKTQSLIEFI
ncbi:MAG: DUF2617 family protein [Gemmataceae bacterium]